jgi:hypothetical protein
MHPTFSSFNFICKSSSLLFSLKFFLKRTLDLNEEMLILFKHSSFKDMLILFAFSYCSFAALTFFCSNTHEKVKAVKLHQSQKTCNFLHQSLIWTQWVVRFQMSFTSQNSHSVKSFCKLHNIFVLCLDGEMC